MQADDRFQNILFPYENPEGDAFLERVIGFDRGSVSELVIDGKTGFVVPPEKGIEGLKEALKNLDQIDPKACRKHVVENFSQEKMVENYERVYKEILNKSQH